MFTKLTMAYSDFWGYGSRTFGSRFLTISESETERKSRKELDIPAQTAIFLGIERGTIRTQLVLVELSINDTLFTKIIRRVCGSESCNISIIDFSSNNITDVAVNELASFLDSDRKISTLILSNNKIGDNGAKLFISILDKNFTITALDLSKNPISPSLLGRIGTLLNRNLEMNKEFGSKEIYVEIAYTLLDLRIPKDLIAIVLDFLNAVKDAKAREIVREIVISQAFTIANIKNTTEESAVNKSEYPQTAAITVHSFEERMLAIHSQLQQESLSMSQQAQQELEQPASTQLLLSGGASNPSVRDCKIFCVN